LRGSRERWRMCGVVRPRRRLPLRPFPCPRPVDRFATGRRCPERRVRNAAHLIPHSGCCWRDQREDLGVGPFVRVIMPEAHPLAWSIACGGLRVGTDAAWSARSVAARGTAEGKELQLEGTASSSSCRWRKGSACAECEMRRRRAAGRRRRTSARDPSTKPPSTRYRIGCLACVPPPPSAGWQSDQN
jgi:hypothetical protein